MSNKSAMPFSETVEDMSEKNRLTQPPDGKDYIGDDGLLYCHKCNEPRQKRIEFGDMREMTVYVNCRCMSNAAELREREEKQEKHRKKCEELREKAFADSQLRSWDFAHDDRKNPKLSDAMKRYAEQFTQFSEWGTGLLLYGTPGTGKSFFAACIANEVINQGKPVLMTNFARILNELQTIVQRQEYIDKICRHPLLVLDDLGVERNSTYALEQVYNIIDTRYRSGKPLIVTSNLTLSEIANCESMDRQRIYDRILEMCHPVQINGESRRKLSARKRHPEIKAILGL